jgi:hypothetical protein
MPLTIEEIQAHEERLRAEMANIQRLLDAYAVFRNQAVNVPGATVQPLSVPQPVASDSAVPASPPALPPPYTPPPAYIHPELKAMRGAYNSKGAYVDWAIRRMTDDFTLRDIQTLLTREGTNLSSPDISCVLTRLKMRGQITEIRPGTGRTPALFRGPENATNPDADQAAPASSMESPAGSTETVSWRVASDASGKVGPVSNKACLTTGTTPLLRKTVFPATDLAMPARNSSPRIANNIFLINKRAKPRGNSAKPSRNIVWRCGNTRKRRTEIVLPFGGIAKRRGNIVKGRPKIILPSGWVAIAHRNIANGSAKSFRVDGKSFTRPATSLTRHQKRCCGMG